MTWEIRLVKWKQKRAKKAEEKRFQRKQKEDLKDAMRQIYQKLNFRPRKILVLYLAVFQKPQKN